ncbi:MAG: hypothetical protein KAV82_05890 [Phycisphaerae bacterium]|nr:hypothetical protein [Phycisphaerae bacterium]
MQSLWLLNRVAMLTLCLALPAWADDDEASQTLQKGIVLFDEGKYLAAQEIFLNLDRDALAKTEQEVRDEYLDRVRVAINMVDKAARDLEAAQTALGAEEFAEAETLFESVLSNEYAPATIRRAADEGLGDVLAAKKRERRELESGPVTTSDLSEHTSRKTDVGRVSLAAGQTAADDPPGNATAQARMLTQRGYAAMDDGRLDEALGLFNQALMIVPGYPEAVSGVEQARAYAEVESGSLTLIERIQQRKRIGWQRIVAMHRDAESEARRQVIDNQFDLARQALLRARQIVESGKEYAEPRSRYESLRAEVDALGEFVEAEERAYLEQQVRKTRDEIAVKESRRLKELRKNKQRRVDALMDQAAEHRKDGNYESAIEVLQQVVVIDSRNHQARWMLDHLEETWAYLRQREALNVKRKETQDLLASVDESKIPWHQFIKYPKNWLEITARPERQPSGRGHISEEDQELKAKLTKKIPVLFDDTPFGEIVETLQDSQQVNLSVVWTDLEEQGITEESPVMLNLPRQITFKKALDEILAYLGGSEVELGYVVSEGIIKIATQELLDRETFVEVYDINDLLMRVPDFTDAPEIDIQQGGGGGGQGSAQQNPFQSGGGGGGGGDDDRRSRSERALDIIELIRETIEPESWRAAGGTDASIHALEANLVVAQTASTHEQIANLLDQLRHERAIQIAVEARFLTITANYLEEMGIDLDIILNQGNAGYDRVNNLGEGTALLLPRSFSRLGFTPGVPGVGIALDPRGIPSQSVTNIRQPYANVGLVPAAGSSIHSGSRMTPIPILSDVLELTATQSTSIPGSLGGLEHAAMQVFGSFLDNIQVDFLLRATQADRRGSAMSAPRLVLFNGQRAWVGVLREQGYVQTVQPQVDETAVAQQPQIDQILTGTVLDVEATVSADKRYVSMTLRPGVAILDGIQLFPYSGGAAGTAAGGGFLQLPSRQLQIIRTTVSVPDGGTLLIGGMKTTEEVEIEAGVPILSKIPVLKRLYSNRSLVKDEQVLLILVKPTIIISSEAEEEAFPTFGGRG